MKLQNLSLAVSRQLRKCRDPRVFQSASGRRAEKGEKASLRLIFRCTNRTGWAIRTFVEFVSPLADFKLFCWHRPPCCNNTVFQFTQFWLRSPDRSRALTATTTQNKITCHVLQLPVMLLFHL